MAEFESKLGKKQISGPPLRDFTVPDQSQIPQQVRQVREHQPPPFDPEAMREFQQQMQPQPTTVRQISEAEKQILEAKRAQREGKERLSEGAKRRIELLVGMTRLTKTVDLGETTYVLQTLKSRELRESLVASAAFDGTVQFSFEYSKQLLARSLITVGGVDLEQFLTSDDLIDKLNFVEELPQSLFTRLYNEYIALDNEAQIKFGIKTEVQAKEVLSDLKK